MDTKIKYIDLSNENFYKLKTSLDKISFGTVVSIDLETTGLDFVTDDILLFSLYFNNELWVINTYNNKTDVKLIDYLLHIDKKVYPIWLGHNIAFDLRMMFYKYWNYKLDHLHNLDKLSELNGFEYHRIMNNDIFNFVYCTQVVEFKLFQGLDKPQGLGDLALFRLQVQLQKDERKSFYNESFLERLRRGEKFSPTKEQIIYTGIDTYVLPDIMNLQIKNLEEAGMEDFVLNIELEVTSILVGEEVPGIRIDKRIWKKQAEENLKLLKQYKKELEDHLLSNFNQEDLSRVNTPVFKRKVFLKEKVEQLNQSIINKSISLKDTNDTTKKYQQILDSIEKNNIKLKEYEQELKELENSELINWGSWKQVKSLMYAIGMHELNQIPKIKDGKKYKFSTGKDAINMWKLNFPDSPYFTFIDLFSKYRKMETACKKYGLGWLDHFVYPEHPNLNNIKDKDNYGRGYTVYHQTRTDTGRLAAGSVDNRRIQSQNIPAKGDFRSAFIANEGYSVMTIDWSGAELRIIEGVSKDKCISYVRKELDGDSHSYVAQAAWRNIFKHRAEKESDPKVKKEYLEKSKNFIVNKKENTSYRTKIKNAHFGILYGAFVKKMAKTLDIPVDEAQIVSDTVKELESDAYNYLDNSKTLTMLNGFTLTHDTLKTRKYDPIAMKYLYENGYLFPEGRKKIEEIKKDSKKIEKFTSEMLSSIQKDNFMDAVHLSSKTRNLPIQGSQAEALKNCLVEFVKLRKKMHVEDSLFLLMTVHDEYVFGMPEYLTHFLPEYIAKRVCESADIVLNGFTKMEAEYQIARSWTK